MRSDATRWFAAAALFVAAWGAVHFWFWAHGTLLDTPTYERYGEAMRSGRIPYRDFGVEYPPGALPAFVVPTFFGGTYDDVFASLMLGCGLATLAFVVLLRTTLPALLFVAVSPALVGSITLSRYDLWPVLFVVAALAAFVHERPVAGWAALGAAIAIKLYAGVLVPVALAWTLRRRGARTTAAGIAAAAAVLAAAFVPFAVVAAGGLWASAWDQVRRPLQVESLAASLVTTFGHPHVVTGSGSQNLRGHGGLAALSTAVQLAVLVALWVAFARGPATRDRFVRYAAAAVCAFVAFGKVLSPQYLIWLVPLVPLVRGRRGAAATVLLLAALVATQVYFPQRYFAYAFGSDLAWLVLARNLLLLALLAVLSLPPRARLHTA